ncbi:MDM31/MDM32 family protein [Abortiporus biennis]
MFSSARSIVRGPCLRHTSKSSQLASLERYSTIRNFFTRAAPTRSPIPPGITTTPRHRLIVICITGKISSPFLNHVRTFHGSRLVAEDASPKREEKGTSNTADNPSPPEDPHRFDNYPKSLRRLALSIPNIHRPNRDDFLNAATGFWQRMRIRFKWITIRSFRRYNADDISAFVTWFFMSQTLWLLVGTTTFFSVIFAIVNSLRLQEYVARAISDYLTAETGITIIFESAIVPKWKDSRISFKNVFVTRRPQSTLRRRAKITAAHALAAGYDVSNHPSYHVPDEEEEIVESSDDEDTNYSMFDLNVDSIDVTLSLARWLDGKGLITDAVIKGVRGVLDRRSVHWDPENPWDPAAYRHTSQPGGFELESLQLEDVLVTVYQPGDFRPYTASIFRADIRTFRKQWLFYDFLSAENVVGQFDNCLFSLHKPQTIGRTTDQDLKDGQWGRMSRFRIDGVNVDHIQAMTTEEGPISWITSGKVDAVLDIKFPRDPAETPLNAFLGEIADAITTAASSAGLERIPGQKELAKPPLSAPSDQEVHDEERGDEVGRLKVIVDIDLRFRDLKAAVPMWSNDLSYTSSALVRPIVAFMNANRTLVPIRCRVVQDLADFDGAWTMWETGLMDAIALKVYEAMAYHVTQANFNRRIRAVSTWSLHMTTNAILSALRSMINPMAQHIKDIYKEGFPFEFGGYTPGFVMEASTT